VNERLSLERAAERLYEDERLRRGLTDDEAKVLLDWAMSQLDAAAAVGQPLDVVLQQVRAAARGVNDLLAVVGTQSPDQLAGRLRTLAGLAEPPPRSLWERLFRPEDLIERLARRLPDLAGPERVRAVLALLPAAARERSV
jgi:hypothetical protein